MTAWVSDDGDFGDEVPMYIELAQARDDHGRFTSAASLKAHDTASATARRDALAKLAADRAARAGRVTLGPKSNQERPDEGMGAPRLPKIGNTPVPVSAMTEDERQRETRRQLFAASQKRIMAALTADPSTMSDEQIAVASRVIDAITPHDYGEIRKACYEVVPKHVAKHVSDRISDLAGKIQKEGNASAKHKFVASLAIILGALGLSFLTAGLGAPAGIAALIGTVPTAAAAYAEYKTEHQKHPVVARAS